MATAKKKAPAKKSSGSKPKFGTPEFQAMYGFKKGSAKTKSKAKKGGKKSGKK